MADGISTKVEVLTREGNFRHWFGQMESILVLKNLDDVLYAEPGQAANEAEQAAVEAALTRDRKVRAYLKMHTKGALQAIVTRARTAKAAWDALHDDYRGGLAVRRPQMLRKATELQQGDDSVQRYIDRVKEIRDDFVEADMETSMPVLINQFVKGLRPALANVVGVQLGVGMSQGAGLDQLCNQLRDLAAILPDRGAAARAAAAVAKKERNKARGPLKCHYCGKEGHKHFECTKKQDDLAAGKKLQWANRRDGGGDGSKEGAGRALCVRTARVAMATVKVPSDRSNYVHFDTGATHNYVSDLSMLHDKRSTPVEVMKMGGNEEHVVACAGTVVLSAPDGQVKLLEALCVPTMHMNLMSGAYVTDQGGSYHGKGQTLEVKDADDTVLLRGTKQDGLYLMDCQVIPTDVPMPTAFANVAVDAEVWHRRFGHVGMDNLYKVEKAADGMGRVNWPEKHAPLCEICPRAKQCEEHYARSSSRAEKPMELVHSDVMGPFPVAGFRDERYAVTLLDDYSSYAEVICVKNKSDVAAVVIERLTEWERQTEHKLKVLRTDHGTEYMGALKRWCRRKGVVRQLSAPRTPKQNGRAERYNRTVLERMRAMLLDAMMLKCFWTFGLDTAAYTRNRIPVKGQVVTPYEKFWGVRPDISHLRVFGCKATLFVPSKLRDKLDAVSEEVIFVGYARHSKAYRLVQHVNGEFKLKESANVSFQEDRVMPAMETCASASQEAASVYHDLMLESPEQQPEADDVMLDDESVEWSLNDDAEDPDEDWVNEADDAYAAMEAEDADADDDGSDSDPDAEPGGAPDAEAGGEDQAAPGRYPQRVRHAPNLPYQAHLFMAKGEQPAEDLLVPPRSYKEAMKRPDAAEWEQAKNDEYASILAKGVFEVRELPPREKALPEKGICDLKFDAKGNLER